MGVLVNNLIGKRFGYLTVVERVRLGYSNYKWKCICDCGNEHFVRTDHLLSGNTKSCGCMHFKACITHGKTNSRLYGIWSTMKARCYRNNSEKYYRYGQRGIKVCEDWKNSFSVFYQWAIEHGYNEGLSIERINNDGDYCPENCRWATAKEQANNTSKNVILEYNGEKKTLSNMARAYGKSPSLVSRRLKRGWDVEKALTT